MPEPNYYEMLEISTDATPEEVREAYRLLAMVWHPDRFPKDSKLWTHANEKMQQINEAYNALKNIQEGEPRPAASATTSSTARQPDGPAQSGPDTTSSQWRDGQEQQSDAVWQRIEEQKRRIQEQRRQEDERRRREDEQRRIEAEARHNIESEQRRTEAERLRVLMREAQRVEEVQRQRATQGLCVFCGQPLSRIEKLKRRDRHRDCAVFMDDSASGQAKSPVQDPANGS